MYTHTHAQVGKMCTHLTEWNWPKISSLGWGEEELVTDFPLICRQTLWTHMFHRIAYCDTAIMLWSQDSCNAENPGSTSKHKKTPAVIRLKPHLVQHPVTHTPPQWITSSPGKPTGNRQLHYSVPLLLPKLGRHVASPGCPWFKIVHAPTRRSHTLNVMTWRCCDIMTTSCFGHDLVPVCLCIMSILLLVFQLVVSVYRTPGL